MSKHFGIQDNIKAVAEQADMELKGKNKNLLLKAMVHAADFGNSCREYPIAI